MNVGIGLLARAPSAGGKSRLAPYFSTERLGALRSALLADTLQALQPVSNLTLFFTPRDTEDELASFCDPHVARVPQSGGDLGERMLTAMRDLLDGRRYDAGILVGSDIPWLSADHLREAIEVLDAGADVVLGPADDGGYYLIGMTRVQASLFENIAWGTAEVLGETMKSAKRIGVDARLIRPAYDVDTIDDLRRLERDLEHGRAEACLQLRRWFSGG